MNEDRLDEERPRRALLVHGNAGCSAVWHLTDYLLIDTEPCVLDIDRPDLPGFGESEEDAPPDADPLGGYVAWLARRTEEAGATPFAAAGNGTGALLCAHLALRRPEHVTGIVMTGPVGLRGGHERLGWLARARSGAALLRLTGRTLGRRRFLADQLARPSCDHRARAILLDALRRARGFHLLARLNRPESLAGLRALACPVTVLWGERDGVLPVTRAEEFMTYLPPHARLEVVPRAGHALPLERPDVVARAIADIA